MAEAWWSSGAIARVRLEKRQFWNFIGRFCDPRSRKPCDTVHQLRDMAKESYRQITANRGGKRERQSDDDPDSGHRRGIVVDDLVRRALILVLFCVIRIFFKLHFGALFDLGP